MRSRYLILVALLATAGAPADGLPAALELEYTLLRGDFEFGAVSRRLERRPDGRYAHSMWTRATGLARMVTGTEWREQGEFAVHGAEVSPRHFSETRTGDKRAYEHRVTFHPQTSQVVFGHGAPQPLPAGLQDQGSAIYALMLNPLTQAERVLPLTDGKDIETHRFIYQGRKSVATAFGEREVVVVRRVSQQQFELERRCRAQPKPDTGCGQHDDFTLWLLPEKHYLPVKLERRRKDETTTMVLREARGV